MTTEERKEAYRAKCCAAEIERRNILGLASHSQPLLQRRRKQRAPRHSETYEDRRDDLGESFD